MPIWSGPQEGSVVQCLDMATHEVKADDEFDVSGCPSGDTVWGYMGQDHAQCLNELL